MSDPQIPTEVSKKTVERLLSLDTPVAKRTLELALLLGLIAGAGYLYEQSSSIPLIQMGAMVVFMFSLVTALFLGIKLWFTASADRPGPNKRNAVSEQKPTAKQDPRQNRTHGRPSADQGV